MVEEPQGAERRRHARHTLIAQVHVRRGREDIVMELVNVSLSGAFVDMGHIARPRWLELGRELHMAITHPISHALVELEGKVRRIVEDERGTGFAVEFVAGDDAAQQVLNELVTIAVGSEHGESPQPPPLPKS